MCIRLVGAATLLLVLHVVPSHADAQESAPTGTITAAEPLCRELHQSTNLPARQLPSTRDGLALEWTCLQLIDQELAHDDDGTLRGLGIALMIATAPVAALASVFGASAAAPNLFGDTWGAWAVGLGVTAGVLLLTGAAMFAVGDGTVVRRRRGRVRERLRRVQRALLMASVDPTGAQLGLSGRF